MTRSRPTTEPVPHHPRHRRDWHTFWRRCICGLPAPCIDRVPPSPPPPYPPRDSPLPEGPELGRGGIYRSRHARPEAGAGPRSATGAPARTAHTDSGVGRAGRLTPAQEHRANQTPPPPQRRSSRRR